MKRHVFPATALALTLTLAGCGTEPATEGAGSSASTVALLTAQERSTARTALAALVGGQDSARFTATATKATLRAYLYLGAYASDVVMGTDAPIGPDEVVLVAAVTGPVDTSSIHRPSGATVPTASGAVIVLTRLAPRCRARSCSTGSTPTSRDSVVRWRRSTWLWTKGLRADERGFPHPPF